MYFTIQNSIVKLSSQKLLFLTKYTIKSQEKKIKYDTSQVKMNGNI